jgi:3-methyladenine DNA glycosylase/8-oxoguanine DNA glycosylase
VALDRPDVLLSGDLALRRTVERAYGFDHLPTEEEMVQLAERWRPYRSLAVRAWSRPRTPSALRSSAQIPTRLGASE